MVSENNETSHVKTENIDKEPDLYEIVRQYNIEYEKEKEIRKDDVHLYLEKECPSLIPIIDMCLDSKYRYAKPLDKVLSFDQIRVHGGSREFNDVDIHNIQKGIGGECGSNAWILYDEVKKMNLLSNTGAELGIANGTSDQRFADPSSNHVFLHLKVGNETIVIDPALNVISFLEESAYTIENIRYPETKDDFTSDSHTYDTGWIKEHDDYRKGQNFSHNIGKYIPLGFDTKGDFLLGLSVAYIDNEYPTFVLMSKNALGNTYISFLDRYGIYNHINEGTNFTDSAKMEVENILSTFKTNNTLLRQ